jgi:hypothetical protein
MMFSERPEHTKEELEAIMAKYKDPAYMQKAIDGVAEIFLNELFPQDNEVIIKKPVITTHRSPD